MLEAVTEELKEKVGEEIYTVYFSPSNLHIHLHATMNTYGK